MKGARSGWGSWTLNRSTLKRWRKIAERIREGLRYIGPENVFINPDCGFFQLPRWLTVLKLRRMVEAAQLVRRELAGG